MPKWSSNTLDDNGLGVLAARAATAGRIVMHIIAPYSDADSYATVTGNSKMNVAMAAGDFTLSSSDQDRVLTVAAKSGVTATAAATSADLHTALVDTVTSEVILVTDSADINIASGNTYNIGSWTYTVTDPT
jgi:hypothetical protein